MFAQFIGNLNTLGFYDFLLPFMFILALTFGLLTKSAVFGDNASVYGVLSLCIAFFSVNYTPVGLFLTRSMPYTAVFLSGVLVLILMLGIFGSKVDALGDGVIWFVALIAVLIFVGSGGSVIFGDVSPMTMSLILLGITMVGLIFTLGTVPLAKK